MNRVVGTQTNIITSSSN